jgi:small conductance mechanosensitive channel
MNVLEIFPFIQNLVLTYGPRVVTGILTLVIGFWVIGWVCQLIETTLTKRNMDKSVRSFLNSVINIGLKILLLLSVAGTLGIQTTSFIAIFTALTFTVGTALSGNLGHFASGILLLVFRPYKIGDLVTLVNQTGYVKDIQVFNTVLITTDNRTIIIPNGTVTSGIIINISGAGEIRVHTTFNVSDTADIDKVREVVRKVADANPKILKTRKVDVYVNNNPNDMTEFLVRTWCESDDYWDVFFYMQEHVKKAFIAEGIPAPKSSLDVQMIKEK